MDASNALIESTEPGAEVRELHGFEGARRSERTFHAVRDIAHSAKGNRA
jgi:hypothetical protein